MTKSDGVLLDPPGTAASAQSLDRWRKMFDTNLFGLIAVTQAFLPLLSPPRPAPAVVTPDSHLQAD